MKRVFFIFAMALTSQVALAQSGVVTSSELNDIRNSYKSDVSTRALRNAIQSNKSLKELALNRDVTGTVDHTFKYKVDGNNSITDQHQSGRCWMFTAMNVFRPNVVEKYNLSNFDFSHNYNYFWDIFEKSNLFLENMVTLANGKMDDRALVTLLKAPINDGGVWNHFYNVAKKYGVVPKSVMPETVHSENTSQMISILNERLRKGAYDIRTAAAKRVKKVELQKLKKDVLKDVYRVLALCLGEPPVKFDWKYTDEDGEVKVIKDLTPQKFFASIAPDNYSPDNYIMVMNDPTRPYYKVYDIDNYRNNVEGVNWKYLNLPNADIKNAAIASIKDNEAMYISCDVGKQLNMKEGVMAMDMYDYESLLGIDLSMDKKGSILTRQSGSAHAMTLVAVDTDENGKSTKWQVENSWGMTGYKGYLTFTDEWFDKYIFRVVLKKEYLNEKAIEALKGRAVKLPIWDYMF